MWNTYNPVISLNCQLKCFFPLNCLLFLTRFNYTVESLKILTFYSRWKGMLGITQHEKNFQQECIPVGCVPPVHYRTVAVGRGVSVWGLSVQGVSVQGGSLSRGVSVQGGSLFRGVPVQGGLYPGGVSLTEANPCEHNHRHV